MFCALLPMMEARAEEPIDFNRDIRPILSENCFFCHGPDAEQREADLRLDEHEAALNAITPHHPEESELISRVISTDDDERMPPPDSNRHLTPKQINLLKRWVASGAEWGQHWSLTKIESPTIPEKTGDAPVHNPIDLFVQQTLKINGMTPSPVAEQRTLLRRVTLDLTGLPPTPERMKAYLEDPSPDAYEKEVDRLLASPEYGERMAWNWLDAARYADSNGYQGDRERTMWPWRDWVIRAFNENLPYDEFTVWQLAGDLLPEATFEQKLATGFCRNHMINGEGGRIAEENRVDYVMDMTETMGTIWMGLTLNCCRCHDHKYDPLTNEDYYSLTAFFNQTPVNGGGGDPQTAPVLPAPSPEQKKREADLIAEVTHHEAQRQSRVALLTSQQEKWEADQLKSSQHSDWKTVHPSIATAEYQTLAISPDGIVFASGPNPKNDAYELLASATSGKVGSVRLDVLTHESHFNGGLARSNSGNFVLTEFAVSIKAKDGTVTKLPFQTAEATFEQGSLKVTNTFDGKPKTGWAVYNGKPITTPHAAVFHLKEPINVPEDSQFVISMRHDSPHESHNIGRFVVSLSERIDAPLEDSRRTLIAALTTPAEERTDNQRRVIVEAHRGGDREFWKIAAAKKRATDALKNHRNTFPKVMVMEDMAKKRETFLLVRGLYNQPKNPVSARVPEALPPIPESDERNRLALAKWLVSDKNPLTARVTVNRFWQQLFGIGLVKTTEDFGTQGEMPENLDLLNWLASDFMEHNWDVKRFIKQIVMSHTYRQSSRMTAKEYEVDPENRLLARGARYRMPSWMIRDQVLAVSGLLVNNPGGPSVNGYQPSGIWEEATFGKKKYFQQHGDALYRRSLYTFWRRIVGPTMFFDNASRQQCTVKPYRTNTPLHALLTLNDVQYVEAARHLAERALTSPEETDRQRLDFIFDQVLTRPPSELETTIFLSGLKRSREEFVSGENDAVAFLSIGESKRNEALDANDHASWTAVCLAMFNLDETLTKE